MTFSPSCILVTGGAGFIGSNFVHHILATMPELQVVTLDLLTYAGSLENLKNLPDESRHTFVQGDICDKEIVADILRKHDVDAVAHFAAESHVDRSITGPAAFVQTNVMGTFTLLDEARLYWQETGRLEKGACRFHHVSTDEVYGTLTFDDPAFSETTPYAPNSPYSASKAGSDHLVRAYHHTYGMPVLISNCSNNYGQYQYPEKLIPLIILNALQEKPLPVYGDGSNIRDWLYVTDHCEAISTIITTGVVGEVYNVGGNCEMKNIDVVKTICAILDDIRPRNSGAYEDLITFVTDRPGHDWRYAIDATKIEKELNWTPQENFETGIRKTIEWSLENLEWANAVTGKDYQSWINQNYEKRK